MPKRIRSPLVLLLSSVLVAASMQSAVYAGVIGTQELINVIDRQATIAQIDTVLARADVRDQLERLGVDATQAGERVAALTDQELQLLADNLQNLPAGGDALGVIGIVFLVLLILELVGVIDIFNRI
ncbi:MAG TPA: PA2779 family protein [Gammaproteobacteria bacterium]|nr:PA2779 family protein [Gammaproteobacteria bacterium]